MLKAKILQGNWTSMGATLSFFWLGSWVVQLTERTALQLENNTPLSVLKEHPKEKQINQCWHSFH